MTGARILIVDDEPTSIELLGGYFGDRGYTVECAVTGRECLEKFETFRPEILILDVRLPDISGLEILQKLKTEKDPPQVIIITAFHDMATTIKAIKLGAFEYIPKPIDIDELEAAVERAVALRLTRAGRDTLVIRPGAEPARGEIIGKTKEMKEIFKSIGILSGNRVNVLIEGETGTGKELVARAIHYHSPSRDLPFIAINCSAIVESLLESELFGHEKGAFTGAIQMKKGKFELAGEGTVFLDEVGEIPFELQAKLLRVLQEREFQRVGGERNIRCAARIIAATNRDLLRMVKEDKFREDLYYRLSVASIKVPALRERREDIRLIVEYLLRKINGDLGKTLRRVEGEALRRITEYEWPGNVRELENVLTRAALQTQGETILDSVITRLLGSGQDHPAGETGRPPAPAGHPLGPEQERERILRVLGEVQWHYGNASRILGISRPTLNKKMKAYGIAPKPRNPSGGRDGSR